MRSVLTRRRNWRRGQWTHYFANSPRDGSRAKRWLWQRCHRHVAADAAVSAALVGAAWVGWRDRIISSVGVTKYDAGSCVTI